MNAEFIYTVADPSQFPGLFQGPFFKGHRAPRVAIVGRSNVGKSSLINSMLKFSLAQTSKKPGKTRAIHFYWWKDAGKIVADLPGYGYANAAKIDRDRWEKFIDLYFQEDQNLERVVLLLDARHGPTQVDLDAIQFLSSRHIPVTFVFSKADTLKTQSLRATRKKETTEALQQLGYDAKDAYWVSVRDVKSIKRLVAGLSAP